MKVHLGALIVVGVLAAPVVLAGKAQGPGPGGFGPEGDRMEQAIEACVGKTAGAEVSLKGREGNSIAAVCTDRKAQLIAVPKDKLERRAQAEAACKGLTEGAASVISLADGRNVAATCTQRHGSLVAVPNERPARHER